ncbi:hypothetical protein ACFE04_025970 [Oxalis oulophora]
MKKSKQKPFTILGQRSITSSLIPRSSNPFKEDVNRKEASNKVSLSDFLGRKLGKTYELPKTVQGKSNPFALVTPMKSGGSKDKEGDRGNLIDKAVFEQFMHTTSKEKIDFVPWSTCNIGKEVDYSGVDEAGNHRNPFEGWDKKGTAQKKVLVLGEDCNLNDTQISRKRSNPFEDKKPATQNRMLVLGNDPRPKQARRQTRVVSQETPKPLYNHYKNGGGWWGSDMEGVDSEEVGLGEVWEGVGSTTYGGIDWH